MMHAVRGGHQWSGPCASGHMCRCMGQHPCPVLWRTGCTHASSYARCVLAGTRNVACGCDMGYTAWSTNPRVGAGRSERVGDRRKKYGGGRVHTWTAQEALERGPDKAHQLWKTADQKEKQGRTERDRTAYGRAYPYIRCSGDRPAFSAMLRKHKAWCGLGVWARRVVV